MAKYHHDGGGLMAMTRNNSSYWYGFEAIGTTRQLMDGQGQVLDAYAFDAWGNELTSLHSQVPNPFKYVGKYGYYLDTQSSLMLLGLRYYNANIGRFLTQDPYYDIVVNLYLYAHNNPIMQIDATGLQPGWCPKCNYHYVDRCPQCGYPQTPPYYPDQPPWPPGPPDLYRPEWELGYLQDQNHRVNLNLNLLNAARITQITQLLMRYAEKATNTKAKMRYGEKRWRGNWVENGHAISIHIK
jgi:hypothetical protein